jgi:hypothetical protein
MGTAGPGRCSVGLVMMNALGETITAIGFALLVVALCVMVFRSRVRRPLAGDNERASLANYIRQYFAVRRWP